MHKSKKFQESKHFTNEILQTTGRLASSEQLVHMIRKNGELRTIYVIGETYYYYFQKEFILKKECSTEYECKIMKANKPELLVKDLDLFSLDGWQLVVIVPVVREIAFYYHFIRVVI